MRLKEIITFTNFYLLYKTNKNNLNKIIIILNIELIDTDIY